LPAPQHNNSDSDYLSKKGIQGQTKPAKSN